MFATIVLMISTMLLQSASTPTLPTGGCEKRTVIVGGRPLDVYRCASMDVSVRAYVLSLSNCLPGVESCLGQTFFSQPAGNWIHSVVSPTGPIEFTTHLAFFPFSYCLPEYPIPVLRDPKMRVEGQPVQIPITGFVHSGAANLVAVGAVGAQIPPQDCYVLRLVNLETLLAQRDQIADDISNIPEFVIRLVREVNRDNPIRRITAVYGYTMEYFEGYRFHEGMDTAWRGLSESESAKAAAIWTPVPLMPVIVRTGWTLGMMPCTVVNHPGAIQKPHPLGGRDLLEAFRDLLRGGNGDLDCALLFGGLHVYTNAYDTTPYRLVRLVYSDACRGRLPLECDMTLYTPPGGFYVPCALEPGYAGAFTPHCHYQAVAISGDTARQILNAIISRENIGSYILPPERLETSISGDWANYLSLVYAKSFDPMIVLYPELFGSGDIRAGLIAWRQHPMPSINGVPLGRATLLFPWYGSDGEFYPGMPESPNLSDIESGEFFEQKACVIQNKSIPGWACRPSWSYYNGPPRGESDPLLNNRTLINVIAATHRAVSLFRQASINQ